MTKTGKTKIMVQVWRPLLVGLKRDLRQLHIKRDGYLNDLFTNEIEALDREVTFRNLDAVRERLRNRRLPDLDKVTLLLDETLVARMDSVLTAKNIPRDSFVNRVLFFLLAKKSHLQALRLEFETSAELDPKPLHGAAGFLNDPFFYIRSANEEFFYSLCCFPDGPFGKGGPNLFALNTAISAGQWELLNFNPDVPLSLF